jgi:hypothetical protein
VNAAATDCLPTGAGRDSTGCGLVGHRHGMVVGRSVCGLKTLPASASEQFVSECWARERPGSKFSWSSTFFRGIFASLPRCWLIGSTDCLQ